MIELNAVFERMPDTPWHVMDDEAIILNMESGHYYSLNELGRLIWEKTDGKNSLKNILQNILDTYEVDTETAKKDMIQLVEKLAEEKLIQPKGGG